MLKYNTELKSHSRKLRSSMTDAERILWSKIRRKQINKIQFYRQKPIGKYIADFYCPKLKIIIEVDGGQHYEAINLIKDKNREEYFKKLGLGVLRFTNLEIIKNINGVMQKVLEQIK